MNKVIRLSELTAHVNDQIEESKEERDATNNRSEKSYNSGEIMALRRLLRWATTTAVPLEQIKEESE